MLKQKKWRRILALILSVSLLFGVAVVAAQAESVSVFLAEIPRGTDRTYKQKKAWEHGKLTLRNGYKSETTSATAKALNDYNGPVVYCLEPSTPIRSRSKATKYTSDYLSSHLLYNGVLKAPEQQRLLSYVLYYGYRGNVNIKTWVTQNANGRRDLAKNFATQLLVWEVIVGERDENFNHLSKAQTKAKNEVKEYISATCPIRNDVFAQYNSMESQIKNALKVPSFMNSDLSKSKTYELKYQSAKKAYEISLTDTNNVLGNYKFKNGSGLSYNTKGNVLTITSDHPITKDVTISATKKGSNTVCGMVVWGDGKIGKDRNSGQQDVLQAQGANVKDPLNAFVKVKAAPALGNLKINKTSEDGKTAFSFRVTGEGYDKTFSTAESTTGTGSVTVGNLTPGTYTISEVNPGNRYTVLSSKNVTVNAGESSTVSFSNALKEQYNVSVVKTDSETGEKLKGAAFEAFTDTNGNGQYDEGSDKSLGTFTDNGDGTYSIKNLKYSDNIFVRETKAPEHYQLNTEVFRIPVEETILNYNLECKNVHDKGIVRVIKKDAETKEALSGAEFTLYADSNGNGEYDEGTDKAVQTIAETSERGTYESPEINTGLYFVKETKAPATFRQDTNVYKANVVSNGNICNISNLTTEADDGTSIFVNQPMKGQIALKKVDAETKQAIKGAAFEVFSDTNGNGQFDEGADKSMGNMTEIADGEFLIKNLRMETYFVKETQAPYGYSIDNTICTVKLEEDHKTYTASNDTEGEGASWNWINAPIHIGTTANDSETKDRLAEADQDVTLVDTVEFVNLLPNTEYTVTGTLMDKATGSAVQVNGKDVTAATTFTTPKSEEKYVSGTVDVTFHFDGSALAGKTTVVYEDLYLKGKKVADHSNIGDDKQTVYFPNIQTSLLDKETSDKMSCADKDVTLVDTVTYSNLIAGKKYTMTGTLMDKATGKAVQVNGKDVTAATTFTPKEANGAVNVTFHFDGSSLAGKTVVAFEELSYNGKELAVHADINDQKQTDYFPETHTTATDVETGDHISNANVSATIVDKVYYSNLILGKEYTVTGTLMDKETGEPVQVAGQNVTASAKLKAAKTAGTVDVIFNFDASALAGKTTVAFETIYSEGKEVAVHADLNDEEQTIHFPEIHTTATDSETGIHNSFADKEITITDSVQYKNLVPGKEYTVTGTLMDKETGEPLLVDEKDVTASTKFTPKAAEGTVDVAFTFDGSALAGKTLVAFETLSYTEKEVAIHADLNDEDQTIWVPGGHTTAVDSETGIRNSFVDHAVTIIDTIHYTGLIPGKGYVAIGTLMDQESVKPLQSDGKEVTASTKFTPEKADGTVDVAFTFDGSALAGKAVVAFETVTYEDKTVFTHADINDQPQTVYFPTLKTTAADAADGDKTLAYKGKVTIVDHVEYTNLIPNTEYKMVGVLMNKNTGKAVQIHGKAVTAATTFTPKEANGTVDVELTFHAAGLDAGNYVVYEQCYVAANDKLVGQHTDINDQGQTVTMPKAPTPHTGDDNTKAIALSAIGAVTLLGITFVLYKKRKEKSAE